LNTGEAVLLDAKVQFNVCLGAKVVTILRKQEFPPSGFLVNYYVSPRQNGIVVP
jgi:hypothetical protein